MRNFAVDKSSMSLTYRNWSNIHFADVGPLLQRCGPKLAPNPNLFALCTLSSGVGMPWPDGPRPLPATNPILASILEPKPLVWRSKVPKSLGLLKAPWLVEAPSWTHRTCVKNRPDNFQNDAGDARRLGTECILIKYDHQYTLSFSVLYPGTHCIGCNTAKYI